MDFDSDVAIADFLHLQIEFVGHPRGHVGTGAWEGGEDIDKVRSGGRALGCQSNFSLPSVCAGGDWHLLKVA